MVTRGCNRVCFLHGPYRDVLRELPANFVYIYSYIYIYIYIYAFTTLDIAYNNMQINWTNPMPGRVTGPLFFLGDIKYRNMTLQVGESQY
jgi:hypothetical protein